MTMQRHRQRQQGRLFQKYGTLILACIPIAGAVATGVWKYNQNKDTFIPPVMASLYELDNPLFNDMRGPTPVSMDARVDDSSDAAAPRRARTAYFPIDPPKLEVPTVLSRRDAEAYRNAFAAQRSGDWKAADAYLNNVSHRMLDGSLLAERYLSHDYTSQYSELYQWLQRYGDHPQAYHIHRLAVAKRSGKDARLPYLTPRPMLTGYGDDNGHGISKRLATIPAKDFYERPKAFAYWNKIKSTIDNGDLDKAENLIFSDKGYKLLTARESDVAQWQLSAHYLARGQSHDAYRLARAAANRSGREIPKLHWIAGIAAWQTGDRGTATQHFVKMAGMKDSLSDWEQAAASFWAYRGLSQAGQRGAAKKHLATAAQHPRTFYGILARRVQGESIEHADATLPSLNREGIDVLYSRPAVTRAVALTQVGEEVLAEKELRLLFPSEGDANRLRLLKLAQELNLPAAQISMAKILELRTGKHYSEALYPRPKWQPAGDGHYSIDPSLVYAFARQESGFYTKATGPNGARGVMQVMPATARMMEKYSGVEATTENMYAPETSVVIGQTYLNHLLDNPLVEGNLIYLAASYNAGPGRIKQWRDTIDDKGDALLFMEMIPYGLTRNYVAQVLTNYWTYQSLEGHQSYAALALAQGKWPEYDAGLTRVAQR